MLLAADGVANTDIADRTGTSRPTVLKWRGRYEQSGVDGLEDDPRPGRAAVIDEVAVLAETLADKGKPPAHLGVTHWSTRLMAQRLGISFASVARIWRKWGIQPHRVETFKFSTDPELEAKLRDVVGLYLDPPAGAVVVSVDEKSQIQALDRTQPILPLRQGIPEQQTHDYIRHGTTSLFAALEVATGKITADACYPRHTNVEFLAFLKLVAKTHPRVRLCVICDNYATHKHPNVRAWLDKNPQNHPALHADQLLVAEHGRDLLRHHHPPSHPPRHLHRRHRPADRDPHLHRQLQRTRQTVHLDQDPPTNYSAKSNVNQSTTRDTSYIASGSEQVRTPGSRRRGRRAATFCLPAYRNRARRREFVTFRTTSRPETS